MNTVVFCPKCHREACRLVKADGQIKIKQGDKTLITTDSKSSGISINCPNGHAVLLDKYF